MPGVLIVEALAQIAAIAVLSQPGMEGRIPYFAGIDGCRFRRPVVPGDVLVLEAELTHARTRIGKGTRQGDCGREARGRGGDVVCARTAAGRLTRDDSAARHTTSARQ